MEIKDLLFSLNLDNLLPEGILVLTILLTILIDISFKDISKEKLIFIPVFGLFCCILSFLKIDFLDSDHSRSFLGSFISDPLSFGFRIIISLSTFICLSLSFDYIKKIEVAFAEFYVLLLTSCLGGMFVAGANDIMMIVLSLETLGLSSYLLTGYTKKDIRSNEAAIKYLIIGAVSTSFILYAFSLLYGLSGGEIQIDKIAFKLNQIEFKDTLLSWIILILIIAGLSFKIGLVPFHQWIPDVYDGSPTPVVAFLSVASKAAGLSLLIRLITTLLPSISSNYTSILELLSILSMILGNLVAITQTSMKRMLSYSSIGQAGFLLIGLIAGSINGYASSLVYIFIYIFMNLGAFASIILFGLKTGSDQIRDYSGLFLKDPFLVLNFSIYLLSLGGIPPFVGFFGKLYLFSAAWESNFYTLVFIGLFTSVISIYYYLRLIKTMIIYQSIEVSPAVESYQPQSWSILTFKPLQIGLYICLLGSTFGGIFINPIIQIAEKIILETNIVKSFIG
jgi:NAD(P)H-quinone oxidoreductase subunit 2